MVIEKNIKKECVCVCVCARNWVILLYSRVWYSIVNQLYFNKKIILNKNGETTTKRNSLFFYIISD